MPRFPLGEEYALLFDHHGALVEDSPFKAVFRRRLSCAFQHELDRKQKQNLPPPFFRHFREAPKFVVKNWKATLAGHHGAGAERFLTQVRVNRVPTGHTLHRFHTSISDKCKHCGALDTLRHRLLECPSRSPTAHALPIKLAEAIFKHSNYPWPDRPPPDSDSTKQLLQTHWPNGDIQLKEVSTAPTAPAMPPLSEQSYKHPDGSLNIELFRDLNPFTQEDKIRAAARAPPPDSRRPEPKVKKSKHRSDRALLIHVHHPTDAHLPLLTISPVSFHHLWDRFQALHPSEPASLFQVELYDLLVRESEGQRRADTNNEEINFRNFWCTPPRLLCILKDLFSLEAERFCNPLNFSPLFGEATTGNPKDVFWGFHFDAFLADWSNKFGYLNPEFKDSMMVQCIQRARAAAMSSSRPVRNLAIIPYHADCPETCKLLRLGHHTERILITFRPKTFSFWPYQIHLGTRSPYGFTPYQKTLAVVVWENQAAEAAWPLARQPQEALAHWCTNNLKLISKDPPRFHATLSHCANMLAATDPPPPVLAPCWHGMTVDSLGPPPAAHAPDVDLLKLASGLLPLTLINVIGGTTPNPATAAASLRKLSLKCSSLIREAWFASNEQDPISPQHKLSVIALRAARTAKKRLPTTALHTGEHKQIFNTSSPTIKPGQPDSTAARSHSSPKFLDTTPPLLLKPGRSEWSTPSHRSLHNMHKHLAKHIRARKTVIT